MKPSAPATNGSALMGGQRLRTAVAAASLPIALALIAGTVAVQPSNYFVLVFNVALITAMLAMSLSLIFSQVGLLSLAHAAYFGIGAYASALLTKELGVPFLVGVLGAGLIAGLLGYLLVPMAKLAIDYYAMGTLAFGLIVYTVFGNLSALTGGWTGLSRVPGMEFFGATVTSGRGHLLVLTIALVLQYLLIKRLSSGYTGRSYTAVRDDELSAQAVGIPVNSVRLHAVTIGCALAGVTGSLMAHMNRFVSPESFAFIDSVMLVLIVAVAGRGRLWVVVVVALVLYLLDDLLGGWPFVRPIIYGGLIVVCMIFLPNGVTGLLNRLIGRRNAKRSPKLVTHTSGSD